MLRFGAGKSFLLWRRRFNGVYGNFDEVDDGFKFCFGYDVIKFPDGVRAEFVEVGRAQHGCGYGVGKLKTGFGVEQDDDRNDPRQANVFFIQRRFESLTQRNGGLIGLGDDVGSASFESPLIGAVSEQSSAVGFVEAFKIEESKDPYPTPAEQDHIGLVRQLWQGGVADQYKLIAQVFGEALDEGVLVLQRSPPIGSQRQSRGFAVFGDGAVRISKGRVVEDTHK